LITGVLRFGFFFGFPLSGDILSGYHRPRRMLVGVVEAGPGTTTAGCPSGTMV
jgi:hypothetical protein